MTRLGGAFWCAAVIATGATNFVVKQTVQNLDDELIAVRKKTVLAQREIHELSADWTFLNQPELLADLNRRFVGLVPVAPKQMAATIDSLPLRPAAPPAGAAPAAAAPPIADAIPLDAASPIAATASPVAAGTTP
ncbi:MAG: hypothetical protein JO258_01660, partial [Alphaproteobacteria bacterium]|nr:hypothetical protein [Alphaproteobacteria bacterium]